MLEESDTGRLSESELSRKMLELFLEEEQTFLCDFRLLYTLFKGVFWFKESS